jgi:hypothetical protein
VGEVACEAMLYLSGVGSIEILAQNGDTRRKLGMVWFGLGLVPPHAKLILLQVFVWNNGKKRFSRKFALPAYSL